MIAMALGNIYGGKSADKSPNPDKLYGRILIAAIWIALIPVVGKYIILGISALLIFTVSNNFLIIAAFAACMVIYAENHSLEYFEQTLGISRYRLCREFSATFHTSPLQYLQGKKIEAAKSLLLSTDNPIHEVGAMVGIDNTNHFIHLFKKHTGVTPFVYRQNAPQSIRETHCPSVPVGLPPR